MDNNTEPDNKDIPDNSSDQHISPDETGDFTTPEELAECAANIDECESVGYLTGGNTFVTAQPEPQTQEQFDRKPLEVKLLNMGFTTEKIASMSDDELKEAVEANTGFEPEYVFGGELTISKEAENANAGAKSNNATTSPAPQEDNDKAKQPAQDTISEVKDSPEVTEIPEDKDISAVFTSLPSGIIECQLPDIGAISLEIQTERTSVIVYFQTRLLHRLQIRITPNVGCLILSQTTDSMPRKPRYHREPKYLQSLKQQRLYANFLSGQR